MADTKEKSLTLPKYRTGRPTKYRREYCKLLVDHMASGLSFESFGGVVVVAKSTLEDWVANYQEFRDAKAVGFSLSRIFWEKMGRAGALGQIKNFSVSAYVFTMKNRFGWSDRTDLRIEVNEDFQKEFGLLRDVPRKELLALAKKESKKVS